MGSSWTVEGHMLIVKGLLKPFRAEDVAFNDRYAYGAEAIGDGRTVKIQLRRDTSLAIQFALANLDAAGYLDHTQTVRVKKLDSSVVLVEFEHQLPLDFTVFYLHNLLPHIGLIVGERVIIIGSEANQRDRVERALRELWDKLHEGKVVRSSQPPKL